MSFIGYKKEMVESLKRYIFLGSFIGLVTHIACNKKSCPGI